MSALLAKTYIDRVANHSNPAAINLLKIIDKKKSNLCVSVDVTRKEDFLRIVDIVGPYVCLIKTHIDIIEDFDEGLITELQQLSERHSFMIFEDRKFADIGNTVVPQYSKGIYKIASWAHFTNAHAIPGPSIIKGLASIGIPRQRGLFLLAQMSAKGSLATGEYTRGVWKMARDHREFVIGFIAQSRSELIEDEDFLILTPGVGLESTGDALGQQYRTPHTVIVDSGCDVIIVGRGIYGTDLGRNEVETRAKQYRDAGWVAYEERLKGNKA